MLSESTLYGLKDLAESLDAANVRLRPKPREILDVIATSAPHYGILAVSAADDQPKSTALQLIAQASRTPNAAGNYTHDLALEQQVALASDAVTAIMDFARNTVNPTVAEIVAVAQNRLSATTEDALSSVDIVQDSYAEVWATPALDSLVADHAGIAPSELSFTKILPVVGNADAFIKTGSDLFDEDVAAAIANRGPEFVTDVYTKYLSNDNNAFPDPKTVNPFGGDRDTILVLFLLANYFHASGDVPEGVAVSLVEYRLYFSSIRAELARRVNVILETRERNRSANRVVLSYPADSFEQSRSSNTKPVIVVNGDTYGEWLGSGGEAEVLLGSYVGDNERSSAALIEKAEQYKAKWKIADRLVKMEARNAILTRTTNAIRFAVGSFIANAADGALPPVPKAQLQKLMNEQIQSLSEKALGNLYHAVRRVVCRTIYAHTHAEHVLSLIDAQVEANPGIEIRDAALLAVIDYVADWVIQWIDVETD